MHALARLIGDDDRLGLVTGVAAALLPDAVLRIGATRVAGWIGGVPAGTRTRDPMIKSHVLYRLSYGHALTRRRVVMAPGT